MSAPKAELKSYHREGDERGRAARSNLLLQERVSFFVFTNKMRQSDQDEPSDCRNQHRGLEIAAHKAIICRDPAPKQRARQAKDDIGDTTIPATAQSHAT